VSSLLRGSEAPLTRGRKRENGCRNEKGNEETRWGALFRPYALHFSRAVMAFGDDSRSRFAFHGIDFDKETVLGRIASWTTERVRAGANLQEVGFLSSLFPLCFWFSPPFFALFFGRSRLSRPSR